MNAPSLLLNAAHHSTLPLHLALVSETYAPEVNGVAHTLKHWVEGLRERGHRVSIIRPRQAHEPAKQADHLLVRGAPIPGYPELQWGVSAHHKLLRQWRRQRPDVVYVATEGPLGLSALRAANKLAIPCLSGFHTNFQQYSQHYRFGWLQSLLEQYLRWFHNRSQRTLVPSEQQQRALVHLGIHNSHVLGRGVDGQRFCPSRRDEGLRAQWGANEQTPVLLYVGRLAAEKNLALLLHSYQSLAKPLPLVIVGDGPLRKSLQKALPQAHFTGTLVGDELARHYASADVFVFPSRSETFGNVVLEAMASGLATLAYDLAAASMLIEHGHNGLLAIDGDEQAFCQALQDCAQDSELRRRLRLNARKSATAFSWQHIVGELEQLLQQTQQTALTNRH